MNLTIKDIITGDEWGELEALQVKINAILALFNRSPIAKPQAEITKAVRGYSKTRFDSWFNCLSCINKLKPKLIHFFDNVFVARRPRRREAFEFEDEMVDIPDKFDLDSNDYSVVYILLQYQNAFGKALNKYSDAKSRVEDIIPIYHCLQREILEIYNNIIAAFGTDTELGKNIGNIGDNGRLLDLFKMQLKIDTPPFQKIYC